MPFVLDCSVTMAWVFDEASSAAAATVLDRLLDDHAVVPGLWRLEVANVLLSATRRGRIERPEWPGVLALLGRLPIEEDRETGERAWSDTLGLAAEHGLSAYDSSYLELAQRRRLPLATLDSDIAGAARAAGLAVLP